MNDYEKELQDSFNLVLSEGGELFGEGGRLERTHRKFSEKLNALEVKHALIGGYALILHGVRRFTEDIDLLVKIEGSLPCATNCLARHIRPYPVTVVTFEMPKRGCGSSLLFAESFPWTENRNP